MRTLKQTQIQQAKSEILNFQLDPTTQNQVYPEIRTPETVILTSNFTKRKYAVPARDNRDMYFDEETGPIIPDIKSQPVGIMLKQAKNYAKRPTPEFESALDLCAQILQKAPLYLDAILFMCQIYMKRGQFDDALLLTSQMMKIVENKHEIQLEQGKTSQFSRELQSKIHAMHASCLVGGGKIRDGLRYFESAFKLNSANLGLQRDLELVRRIVSLVNG